MNQTIIECQSIGGLNTGNFIHIEEQGHSSEYYDNGAKYKITDIDIQNKTITIDSLIYPDETKTLKWCLAKDDVSPHLFQTSSALRKHGSPRSGSVQQGADDQLPARHESKASS